MKSLNLALVAATFLLLGACASAPKQPAKAVPDPSVTLEEINLAIENGVKLQDEKGEEMVCRREPKLGSRIARETICMTKTEWSLVSEESQRAAKKTMKPGNIPRGMQGW